MLAVQTHSEAFGEREESNVSKAEKREKTQHLNPASESPLLGVLCK